MWVQKCEDLCSFAYQAFTYYISKNRVDFAKISVDNSVSGKKQFHPLVIEAFNNNILSASHHSLLYEPAFKQKWIDDVVCAYFPGKNTDVYWGEFITDINDSEELRQKKIANAIKMAMAEASQNGRFSAFVDVGKTTKDAIDKYGISLKGFNFGDLWVTKVQEFDLYGWEKRNFRHSINYANRQQFRLEEVSPGSNVLDIQTMISRFSSSRKLSYPRVGAALIHPFNNANNNANSLTLRRIWKMVDQKNNLIGVITATKMGKEYYFFETLGYEVNKSKRLNFLFDWGFSQVILILKQEGVKQVSWGRIPHLINEEDIKDFPDLWLVDFFYTLSNFKKFRNATAHFKKDFSPIEKTPKWAFYSEFKATVFLDVAKTIGWI